MTAPRKRELPESPVTLCIDGFARSGEGLARWEGVPVLVPDAAPGDRVEASLAREGKTLRARVLHVVEPGPGRHAAPCPLAGRCGGCDWLHLTDSAQQMAKQSRVVSALESAGATAAMTVHPLLTPAPRLAHRRRATLHVGASGLFFYERRTHTPVVVSDCPALVEPLAQRLPALTAALAGAKSHVAEVQLLAEGAACAAGLVLKGAVTPAATRLAERVQAAGFQGVVLVPFTGAPFSVGEPELLAEAPLAPNVSLRLRPDAFAQAHAEGNRALVAEAVRALALEPETTVLELFGGNGNFTFALAQRAREVWMVEGSRVAIGLARRAADAARVTNVRFIEGEVERVTTGLAAEKGRFGTLLADPPRTGFPALGSLAQRLGVARVVYVACDTEALRRDARALGDAGFQPRSVQGLDLFPQTHHVEAVVAFTR